MPRATIVSALTTLLGAPHVLIEPQDMAAYLQDWRGRYQGHAWAVVRPGSTEEVAAVVRTCAAAGVAVVPQGGNTGLCGGATPLPHSASVVLSMQRLNRMRSVTVADNALVAEAGCTLSAAHEAAQRVGRYFPLSLAAQGSCQIGGNVSTNAGGVHVLRYGMMRDLVLGLEVVLPDGRVWSDLRALKKDNTGYALRHLFIGAEGTLGVVTAVSLKLWPRPRVQAGAWVTVPSPAAAVALLGLLRDQCGERVEAFELMGAVALNLVRQHVPGCAVPLNADAPWAVLVELADVWAEAPLEALLTQALAQATEAGWVCEAVLASNLSQLAAFWAIREAIPLAQKHEGISIKHDIAVPVSQIESFLTQADAALLHAFPGARITAFGHVGDGNLHYNLSHPDPVEHVQMLARTEEVNRIVYALVDALGGSFSAEHGIGQLKIAELAHYRGAVALDMMRQIKHAFDPLGTMNPGKVVLPLK